MRRQAVAWLGLGANLADPAAQLQAALAALDETPGVHRLAVSVFYRTAPVGGPVGQPEFCNAAAAIATVLEPQALLARLQAIEAAQGRVRDTRWGPRTLDLDILAYDDRQQSDPSLTLPHPRAHERAFVLVPLADIAPALSLGRHGRVVDCLARCTTDDIRPWTAAA